MLFELREVVRGCVCWEGVDDRLLKRGRVREGEKEREGEEL